MTASRRRRGTAAPGMRPCQSVPPSGPTWISAEVRRDHARGRGARRPRRGSLQRGDEIVRERRVLDRRRLQDGASVHSLRDVERGLRPRLEAPERVARGDRRHDRDEGRDGCIPDELIAGRGEPDRTRQRRGRAASRDDVDGAEVATAARHRRLVHRSPADAGDLPGEHHAPADTVSDRYELRQRRHARRGRGAVGVAGSDSDGRARQRDYRAGEHDAGAAHGRIVARLARACARADRGARGGTRLVRSEERG